MTVSGGGSGNLVTLSIDPGSALVCSISGSTVTFLNPGSCVIDANQAGNAQYQAATQAHDQNPHDDQLIPLTCNEIRPAHRAVPAAARTPNPAVLVTMATPLPIHRPSLPLPATSLKLT